MKAERREFTTQIKLVRPMMPALISFGSRNLPVTGFSSFAHAPIESRQTSSRSFGKELSEDELPVNGLPVPSLFNGGEE